LCAHWAVSLEKEEDEERLNVQWLRLEQTP